MDVDVAVLGGGPGGYTAAIRVAQLGANVACIEKEPELGGTCLRVGCIPTKAWVQTSFPLRPPIPGLDSPRCVDSTGLLAQAELPRRLVILGGGIIGCEFASIFRRFGAEVTVIEMLDSLIPQEDADASKELAKQFGRRGIGLQLGKQCTQVDDDGSQLTVYFGDGETVQADLMLVSVGRGPVVEGLGLEEIGVQFDKRKGIAADEHRRTTVPHIYAVGDCAGDWQLSHSAFSEGA